MLFLRNPFYLVSFNIRVNCFIIKFKSMNTIYGTLNYVDSLIFKSYIFNL